MYQNTCKCRNIFINLTHAHHLGNIQQIEQTCAAKKTFLTIDIYIFFNAEGVLMLKVF